MGEGPVEGAQDACAHASCAHAGCAQAVGECFDGKSAGHGGFQQSIAAMAENLAWCSLRLSGLIQVQYTTCGVQRKGTAHYRGQICSIVKSTQ